MGSIKRMAVSAVVAMSAVAVPMAIGSLPPVDSVDVSTTGVSSRDGTQRFVTFASPSGTTIARIARRGGSVQRSRFLSGRFTIPPVAYDRSASGLSADGDRLVLAKLNTSYPRRRSTFAVLDARRLRLERVERLEGDFSFDAISPNGRWMYLTRYISPGNPTAYEVLAYDLRAHRLMPRAIVDPREPGEKMQGSPVTRATSANGRWAYTLYETFDGSAPFIHALDTAQREARCIDLDLLHGRSTQGTTLEVAADGATLTVKNPTAATAIVDTRTFAVSPPVAAAASPEDAGGREPWLLATGGVLIAVLAGLGLRHARRDKPHPSG